MARKINGEAKLILAKLDEHTVRFNNLDLKIDKIIDVNARQDVDINAVSIKSQSCQSELKEHKDDHKWNAGFVVTIATFISGAIAWLIGLITKKGG